MFTATITCLYLPQIDACDSLPPAKCRGHWSIEWSGKRYNEWCPDGPDGVCIAAQLLCALAFSDCPARAWRVSQRRHTTPSQKRSRNPNITVGLVKQCVCRSRSRIPCIHIHTSQRMPTLQALKTRYTRTTIKTMRHL